MTEYNITIEIEGHESGLTANAVKEMFKPNIQGDTNASVTVTRANDVESTPNENVTVQRDNYVNIFSNGTLVASVSEEHDELLMYQSGTDEPLTSVSLSALENGEILSGQGTRRIETLKY
jgi:hypothetical protein